MYLRVFSNASESSLNYIYSSISIFPRVTPRYVAFAEKLPLAVISAFICLGKKYDIRTLYVEAVKKLFQEVPATLAEYDGPTNDKWIVIDDPEYMDLAILARKAGLLSILPYLLFVICSIYSSDEIKNGFLMPDGKTNRLHSRSTCMPRWLSSHLRNPSRNNFCLVSVRWYRLFGVPH